VVEVKTRASEAKGPFPGGKRVGSWGKKKSKSKKCKCEDGLIFFSRLIVSGMLRWCKLLGLFLPFKKKLP